MAFRFFSVIFLLSIPFFFLGFKLYELQIANGAYYVARAQVRVEAAEKLALRRGKLFFTDKNFSKIPVAINRDYPVIYAVPQKIDDPIEARELVASSLGIDRTLLEKAFSNSKSLFQLLVEKASPEQVAAVEAMKLKGVYVDTKQYRYYPYESLASQLLGFVGVNESYTEPAGLYGMEKAWDDLLSRGEDVALTIDRTLQTESESILSKLIVSHRATGGTIIIEEPSTGKILTMASKPDFNPNTYKDFPLSRFLNPAVQLVYEPGSVFKPITMSAGIDSGAITPDTTYVDTGSVTLNGKTIRNWDKKAHGRITMTNVIEQSVNTGAVFAEQKIGHETFLAYLQKFGFGERTGIEVPDELPGSIKNLSRRDVRAIDFATASFGQGTAVTPLQVVNAFSAIANGGLLMRPYVDARATPLVIRRVIREETAAQVVGMMESAVEKAKVATIPQYRIAGKTGTAFVPDFQKGGYTDQVIHTYVGFAPVSKPKFVILIKLDKPQIGELAGATVVPAFRQLAEFALNYYSVVPDKPITP